MGVILKNCTWTAALFGLTAITANAQTPQPVTAVETPTTAAFTLPAGTPIDLVFVEAVDSKANKVGDIIHMKVADDIQSEGVVIVPAGTPVSAEVIHAARARAGGKPGELIISARFIQLADRQIALKGFKFGTSGTGKSAVTESYVAAAVVAPVLALFIAGGEKHAGIGTRAFAKLKDDLYSNINVSTTPDVGPAPTREGSK
jgi:hypothetical protein